MRSPYTDNGGWGSDFHRFRVEVANDSGEIGHGPLEHVSDKPDPAHGRIKFILRECNAGFFASESTSAMIQSFLKFLSFMFNIYTKYIDPPNKGISELEDKIKEQEQELEDYTSPEMIDKVNFFTDTTFANQYDFNEYMQAMPANMTSGKNRALMNKHYDSGY